MTYKESIYYTPAGEDRLLHIYLPDRYDETDERYPVMYFWDGHNLFHDADATYGKSWGLKAFLDGWRKDMIIVGIECSHEGNRRLDEYCPYDGQLMGIQVHGEGRRTMEWITGTLKPCVDSRLRTYSHREATAIGGSSMGGLMSLYAVTMYNDVFSKAACVSPTISIVREQLFAEIAAHPTDPDTRVYLSVGGNENWHGIPLRDLYAADDLLRQKSADTFLYFQEDGGHCEADWEKQVPLFMEYLW